MWHTSGACARRPMCAKHTAWAAQGGSAAVGCTTGGAAISLHNGWYRGGLRDGWRQVGSLMRSLTGHEARRRGRRRRWHQVREAGAEVRGGGVGPAEARSQRPGAREWPRGCSRRNT